MKLLIFSDIHGDCRTLERLLTSEADYYVAAGDLVTWARGFEPVGNILQRRAGQVYVLPGNHESDRDIDSFCARFGLHSLHGRSLQIAGYAVAGLGYSSPTPFNTPGEYSELEMASHLAAFAGLKPLVLICHCPPKGTPLDRVRFNLHAGSQSVREFIERYQPEYFFCGHIHEAEGVETQIGRTRCINVGKKGYLLHLEETAPS